MSAYSEWKCGAISDEDYTASCNMEDARDKAAFAQDDYSVENCEYYKDDEAELEKFDKMGIPLK